MKQLLPFVFFLAVLTAQAQSQTKLSTEPADFVGDVKAMLVAGKVENAEALSADLEEVWSSGKLSSKQKTEVIDIAQRMYRKRMRSTPHFSDFFTTLTAGIKKQNLRADQLDNLLEVTGKAVKQEDTKRLEQFLRTTSLYMDQNKLFQNSYYSLRTSGGSFSFAYEGGSKPVEEQEDNAGAWDSVSWDDEVSTTEEETWVDDGWGTATPQPKKEEKKVSAQKRLESLKRQFVPTMPKVSGPVLKLDKVALVFVTPWDSVAIQNTGGQLMLAQNVFVGEGGTFDWQVKEQPASAELGKYSFNTSFAGFKAPEVKVNYSTVLAAPVEGALEWMSSKRKTGNYPYPKFTSFTSDARLNNLGGNTAYTGGFSLSGNIIGSRPLDGSLSQLVVSYQGKRKFRTLARNYTFEDSLVLANRAAVAVYQEKDSLTHPAMQLRYSRVNQNLTLTKDKGPYARTPFYDSYHNLEITAERVHWNLNQPEIEFSILNTKTLIPVQLESTEYYSNERYQQLVGIAPFHPLQVLVGYGAKIKSSTFYTADVARATRLDEKAVREAAQVMSYQGYLDYDPASGYVQLKNKAWHYVGASRDKNDYDHIVIKSVVPSGRNATLNLENNKLTVRGVNKILFNNDTASVFILPRRQEVHILKNRDIEFDGQVYASRLALRGKEFRFNYDEFSIDLAKLDTIALVSKRRGARASKVPEQVLTSNSGGNLSGKLYINKPSNKSGEKFLAEYPKFDAVAGAQMAFARPDVAGGAYDSTVYFDMPPFKLDSLSSGKRVVAFDGTFNSGGIFPPIKTKLQMMPDETLGFYYQPSAQGLAAYGGKGVVYDTIMMSSAGIQSKGKLQYLSATLQAPVYTFYKNGAVAEGGTEVTIKEATVNGTAYPVASLKKFNMNWQPQADTMYLQTTDEPMKVYKEGYTLAGVAKLSPGGLYGSGVLDNANANVTSPKFLFGQRSFSGNNAQMLVKSDVEGRPAVKALDVAFTYDMTTGFVDFESEQKGAASMEFPKTQYKTSMSSARWDMNTQKVSLKADENGGKNWFYSQHPEQEGLKFMADGGEYGLKENTLHATGVPYIAVADAFIMPDSGKVAVSADATMRTLRNAKVLADSVQQHHKMYSGNIDVLSRLAFKGDAVHDYYNAAGDSFRLVFADFVYGNPQQKKKPVYTYATATLDEEVKPFYIFPRIMYRGKAILQAPNAHMDFDGEVKLNFTGNPNDSDWFPYKKDTLNPTNVRIPILKPKAADGSPLHTGLHVATGSGKLYNTFVSRKQGAEDLDLFTVDGLLSYDKANSEFKIGREARAYGNAYEGNVLRYNETSNTIHFEGKLNLLKSNKNFGLEASGSGDANVDSSRYELNTFLAFDMNVPSQALNAMAGNLRGNAVGISTLSTADERMLYKLGEFIGDKEVRKYKEQSMINYVPLPKLSKKLERSLVLSNVDLRWSNEQKAWYSVGGISVASSLKDDINASMNGYLEMKQDMHGEPVVNLFLQADPYTWYYFSYFENGLSMVSSDDKFNKAVSSKSKGSRGSSGSYSIYDGALIEKNEFLNYFQNTYLGGKEGFKAITEKVANQPTGNFDFISEEDSKKEKKKKKKKEEEEQSEIF
ncbi:hypothetical protein POKO110462_16670 [Pontibacter korlensis]|uniref:Uncharacterized protein n=1 Tax=Pontibacter korlensis TaxID=400092 RepID=A0A0E3ZDJ4_9BACT|nr:hypothetical protein [Pontibacter korlensis]AKD02460.1 hypothetical protein PKOR_04185 [Pontibacter korlensis]